MENGSSSSSSAAGGGPDSFNGLRFGKKIYFEGVGSGLQHKTGAPMPQEAALPPSPAKKARSGFVQGSQPPRCQVEGCKVDLSDAKAYYSRHKVCGMHSKSPMVIVAGLHQRFCQQCSRFHQLPEFDQGKRSCRRRLAGHNERRRKPPQGSLLSPRYGTLRPSIFGQTSISQPLFCLGSILVLSSGYHASADAFVMSENPTKTGGFVMDFSAYSTLTGRDSESGNHQLPWQSSSQNPLPHPSYSGPRLSSEEYFNGASGSTGALSLLSNQPWGSKAQSSSLGVNNLLDTNGTPMVQPSVDPGATVGPFACSSWGFKDNQRDSTLHDMHPVLGQYAGELGLAQPNEGQFHELDQSRGYDSSIQHTHWPF